MWSWRSTSRSSNISELKSDLFRPSRTSCCASQPFSTVPRRRSAPPFASFLTAPFHHPLHVQRIGSTGCFCHGPPACCREAGESDFFAYCDQDDVWHPAKLSRLAGFLIETKSELVYCDARVVDEQGQTIAPSLHQFESRDVPHGLLQHLLLNAVSGMTALFTRRTAELAWR